MPTNDKEQIRGIPMTDALWDKLTERGKENGRAACREAAAIIKAELTKGDK